MIAALPRRHVVVLGAVLVASLALAACKPRDVRRADSSPRREPDEAPLTAAPPLAAGPTAGTPTPPFPAEAPLGCATLRDVSVSDVVRVDGKLVFYADAARGLTIVDAADPAHPRVLAVAPFVGNPLALFVREGLAWLVFVDPDSRSGRDGTTTVVRAIDVRDPARPRLVGEQLRPGPARHAQLVGGLLYVLRGVKDRSVVEAFGVVRTKLELLDQVDLDGTPAQLAASPAGLAAVTTEDDHTRVAWLDLSMERAGSLLVRRTVRLPGGIATWDRGEAQVVDADEGQRVRLVTCASRACSPTEPASLQIVDFGFDAPARGPEAFRLTEHDGLPTTRFADGVLYVADTAAPAGDSTTLHVVLTHERVPRFAAHLPLRGRITALVPHDGSLVALGSIGSTDSELKLVVHDIDVRQPGAPQARSSVVFGSDWTWSIVADDARAMSFDPSSDLLAVPFTAWRQADKRYVTAAQLVDPRPGAAQTATTLPADGWTERAVFLDGHLLTFGPSGVSAIDYASTRRPDFAERPLVIGR
jgi:hypothetical protein